MSSPSRFASITRRLEELPSDGGQAVDTLAGANLRIFIRLNELEAEVKRLGAAGRGDRRGGPGFGHQPQPEQSVSAPRKGGLSI